MRNGWEKNYLTALFGDEHAIAMVGDLLKLEDFDPALMNSAISELLQRGILATELDDKLFGALSILRVAKR